MIYFHLVRVACQTVSVFYFPPTEVATCSPQLPIFNFGIGAMHLHHSLRKLELALHDFGVFEVYMLVS